MSETIFFGEHITKHYSDSPVLRDVSLELPEGGFVSLLGPSGAGKTTLFNILAGVDAPDEGCVVLAGEDVTGISGRVSYMLQKDLLLEYRTVIDNVILPLVIHGETKKRARESVADFFPRFGLAGYEKKYPRQLSGGMRQRAALLRTCMTRNKVILLDEPFSALDALTRIEMHDWFLDIAETMGLSTLFITHDVEEAIKLSDTVYILTQRPGRVTHRVDMPPPRARAVGFSTSLEFAGFKREILEAIGIH
jgi:ABC-type nitrate/sulfonate/bicarbonate transport system ATPase subunit